MTWHDIQKSRTAWAQLNTTPPKEIADEFERVRHLLVDHRSSYGNGWQSLTLHGERADWTEAINQYPGFENVIDWEYDYHWTEIADACSITKNYIRQLPYVKLHRVRFMFLHPHGLIDYHRDSDKMNLSPLNISINMPQGCEFNIYDQDSVAPIKTVPFTDQSAFFVNIGHYHRVINRSNEGRLHIIVHGKFTDDFTHNPSKYVSHYDEVK